MDLATTLRALDRGLAVTRCAWKESGATLQLHRPAPESALQTPLIYLHLPHGQVTLWEVQQQDLRADDWMIHVPRPN